MNKTQKKSQIAKSKAQKAPKSAQKTQRRKLSTNKNSKKKAQQQQLNPSHLTLSQPLTFANANLSSQLRQFSSSVPNPAMQRNMNRPATGLYRDCLRLIDYMAGKSTKSDRLREIIRGEFEKNRNETDPKKIETMKGGAIQGLSNYLTIESLARAGNKFMVPEAQKDRSLFDRRRQMTHADNQLSIEELQQLENDGPQEYGGVSISGDFASQGVDIGHVEKDQKASFVKEMVDEKNKV